MTTTTPTRTPAARSLDNELAGIPPGPRLAARLATLNRTTLTGSELIALTRARLRQLSHDQAQLTADIVELAHSSDETRRTPTPQPFADTEIACALTWTSTQATRELSFATTLLDRLPAVHAALLAGTIDRAKAAVFIDTTAVIENVTVARHIADQVLPLASGLNTREIARKLRTAILTHDPDAAARRAARSHRRRRVETGQHPDGTAYIAAHGLPTNHTATAIERIDALAHATHQAGDPRTLEQLRADVLLGLLNGTWDGPTPTNRANTIELTVPLTTLMGLQDLPADLAGWGPICADLARQTARQTTVTNTTFRYTVHHNGTTVAHGTTRHRPPTTMAATVRANTDRCIAPGCLQPASRCDLDHRIRRTDGGPTTPTNLAPLCRRHHRAKDEGGWRYHRTTNNTYQWTSPLGQHYTVDRRRFPDEASD